MRPVAPDVHAYASDRVFDGKRTLSPALAAKLRGRDAGASTARDRRFGFLSAVPGAVAALTFLRQLAP